MHSTINDYQKMDKRLSCCNQNDLRSILNNYKISQKMDRVVYIQIFDIRDDKIQYKQTISDHW